MGRGRVPCPSNFISLHKLISLVIVAASLLGTSIYAQDIEGGTGVIIAPPKNPVIRRRSAPRAAQQSRSAQSKPPQNTGAANTNNASPLDKPIDHGSAQLITSVTPKSDERTTIAQPATSIADQVDEALEQGNAARDADPPRYAEAERAYKKAAALDARDARAYAGLGNIYYDQRSYAEAENNFRLATELDASDADAHRYLALTYIKAKKFREAEQSAKQAVRLEPQNFYGYSALGWAHFRLKNYPEAEAAYHKAIALSPQTFGLYSDLGLFLAQQGRYQEAVEPYRKALELNAAYAPALANYGVVMQKLWKLAEAEDAFVRFLKANNQDSIKTAPVRSNLALVYYHQGDRVKAAAQWEAAARLGSTSPLDRAGQLIVKRRHLDARVSLESYVRANPGDENGWLMLGDAIAHGGDRKLAQKAYDNAARVAPLTRGVARPKMM
ncbi:MAG: tetratricopeptide repeat protein [Pyrinomonadaceae bacterium]